jgi:hypothetical protein
VRGRDRFTRTDRKNEVYKKRKERKRFIKEDGERDCSRNFNKIRKINAVNHKNIQITNLPLELLRIILSFYTNQVNGLLSFSLVYM